jgi:hypothetical protein
VRGGGGKDGNGGLAGRQAGRQEGSQKGRQAGRKEVEVKNEAEARRANSRSKEGTHGKTRKGRKGYL